MYVPRQSDSFQGLSLDWPGKKKEPVVKPALFPLSELLGVSKLFDAVQCSRRQSVDSGTVGKLGSGEVDLGFSAVFPRFVIDVPN